MTVAELIARLQDMPPDAEALLSACGCEFCEGKNEEQYRVESVELVGNTVDKRGLAVEIW